MNIWQYFLPSLLGGKPDTQGMANAQSVETLFNQLSRGDKSAEEVMASIAQNGYKLSPEQESYLSSMLSNQRTNEARDYETEMANTDFTRAAAQLGALGMSPYNVAQTGASATPNVSAASTPMLNNANQRLGRLTSVANSMISMASRMASAGIYGNALQAVQLSAQKAAALSAHSARLVTTYDKNDNRTGRSISETLPADFDYSQLF